jgi:hypothetical protein
MTFEAQASAFATDDVGNFAEPIRSAEILRFPTRTGAAEPEAGWATRNPARAMALLFVDPRDCAMVDELMAS